MKTFKYPINLNNAELMNTELQDTRLDGGEATLLRRAGYITVGDLVNDISSDGDIDVPWIGPVKKFNIMRELFRLSWDSLKENERVEYLIRLAKENEVDVMKVIDALLRGEP